MRERERDGWMDERSREREREERGRREVRVRVTFMSGTHTLTA